MIPGASLKSVLCSCEEKKLIVTRLHFNRVQRTLSPGRVRLARFQSRATLNFFVACRALWSRARPVLVPCQAHGDAHAAADAQRGEALLRITLLHFMQQRHEDAGAGGADRMADRD